MSQIPLPSMNPLSTLFSSVELAQKAWSGFNLPPQFAPTMDVKELDKRLTDLRAVEQWLSLNLKMLNGTIEGLEMQRNAIAAIHEFGKATEPEALPRANPAPPPPAQPDPSAWWNLLQSQFNQIAEAALRAAPPRNEAVLPGNTSAKKAARPRSGSRSSKPSAAQNPSNVAIKSARGRSAG